MRSDRQKLINEQTYKMKREEKSFTTKREGEKYPSFVSVCAVCNHLLAKTIYLKKKITKQYFLPTVYATKSTADQRVASLKTFEVFLNIQSNSSIQIF